LLVLIRGIHAEVNERYGSPRIHAALADRGETCSLNAVAMLMHDNHIRAKSTRKFRCKTTDSHHALPVAENVLGRQFDPEAANEVWVADITYIPTALLDHHAPYPPFPSVPSTGSASNGTEEGAPGMM
jgi:transposase InsO family protein